MARTISAKKVFREWRKDPAYAREYEALEQEFALASAVIGARVRAGLTQEQLAERIHTSQSSIARLEGGRSKPSTSTLEKIAAATNSKLRVTFEPA